VLHGKALIACMQVLSDRVNEFAGPLSHHAYESQNWGVVLRFARQAAGARSSAPRSAKPPAVSARDRIDRQARSKPHAE